MYNSTVDVQLYDYKFKVAKWSFEKFQTFHGKHCKKIIVYAFNPQKEIATWERKIGFLKVKLIPNQNILIK